MTVMCYRGAMAFPARPGRHEHPESSRRRPAPVRAAQAADCWCRCRETPTANCPCRCHRTFRASDPNDWPAVDRLRELSEGWIARVPDPHTAPARRAPTEADRPPTPGPALGGLTDNQQAALRVLRREHPTPISPTETARWGGLRSVSSARTALMALARKGLARQIGAYWAWIPEEERDA